jgi:hypothetical protein
MAAVKKSSPDERLEGLIRDWRSWIGHAVECDGSMKPGKDECRCDYKARQVRFEDAVRDFADKLEAEREPLAKGLDLSIFLLKKCRCEVAFSQAYLDHLETLRAAGYLKDEPKS